MVPFAVDPGRTALVIVDMQNVFVADSPVAGGVINDGAPLAALHSLVDVRPDDIIVGKPRGSAASTAPTWRCSCARAASTRSSSVASTPTCPWTPPPARPAVHEFRDSGSARGRAARGACRRPGTGWLVRRHGLASHAWGGAAGTALGSSQAQDGTGEFARALDVLAGHGPAR